MSRQIKPLARTSDLIVQSVDRETIIYDGKTNKAYVLNPTAAAVWRASNGKRSVSELAAYLSHETPTTERTVWYALGQLNDLLEEPVTLPNELVGLSRRKFLKLSGAVAAGVAIPMVVKMVAPTPAHAQSGGDPPACCVCTGGYYFIVESCGLCSNECASVSQTIIACVPPFQCEL
jgi:hypothetical protein